MANKDKGGTATKKVGQSLKEKRAATKEKTGKSKGTGA